MESFELIHFYRALDFIYIDYRPPHPLDVLITPEILSKYQRMFAFILRLLRGMCPPPNIK